MAADETLLAARIALELATGIRIFDVRGPESAIKLLGEGEVQVSLMLHDGAGDWLIGVSELDVIDTLLADPTAHRYAFTPRAKEGRMRGSSR